MLLVLGRADCYGEETHILPELDLRGGHENRVYTEDTLQGGKADDPCELSREASYKTSDCSPIEHGVYLSAWHRGPPPLPAEAL